MRGVCLAALGLLLACGESSPPAPPTTTGGVLEGVVTEPAGRPVSGAIVAVAFVMTTFGGDIAPPGLQQATGEDGRYRIEQVPEGRYVVEVRRSGPLLGKSRDLVPRHAVDVAVGPGQPTRLDFVLDHGASVEGQVSDESGAGIADALVHLERVIHWHCPDLRASAVQNFDTAVLRTEPGKAVLTIAEDLMSTDEHGNYAFAAVMAGDKRLATSGAMDSAFVPQERKFGVAAGQHVRGVDFRLYVGRSVRGTIVDGEGAPVRGASITVRPKGVVLLTAEGMVWSDEQGRFEVKDLAPGPSNIHITREGHLSVWEAVEPGGPEKIYQFPAALQIHGIVSDAADGQPVESFATRVSSAKSMTGTEAAAHEGGRFVVEVDADGPWTVSVAAPGYEELAIGDVVPGDTVGAPLRFQLKKSP